MANSIGTVFIQEVMKDSELLSSLFSNGINCYNKFLENIPLNFTLGISEFVNNQEKEGLPLNFEFLTTLIKNKNWIVGDK